MTVTAYHHHPPAARAPGPSFMPHVFAGLWCRCGATHHQAASYYASVVRDDGACRLLLGPFPEHHEALAVVPRARALGEELDPQAVWYRFGTMAMQPGYTKPGILTDRVAALDAEPAPVSRPRRRAGRKVLA